MTDDKKLSLCAVCMMLGLFLVNSMNILGDYIGITPAVMSNVNKGLIFVSLLFSATAILRRMKSLHIIVTIIYVLTVVVNIVLFPENQQIFKETASTFLFTIFPIIIVFISIEDYSVMYRFLLKSSYIILVLSIIVLLLSFTHKNSNELYTMGYSNSMIFPMLITFRELYLKFDKTKMAIFTGALLSMLILGSRGAFIAIFFYVATIITKNTDFRSVERKKVLLWMLCITIIVFHRKLLMALVNILLSFGVSSRTLNLFTNKSDGIYLSGRSEIYPVIWDAIKNAPFDVRGINADYRLAGIYSHNIVLEVIYEMGAVFGSIFLIYILICALKTLRMKNNPLNDIIIISMCSSLPKLFISGTLWTQVYFWVWLCLFYIAKARKIVVSDSDTEGL